MGRSSRFQRRFAGSQMAAVLRFSRTAAQEQKTTLISMSLLVYIAFYLVIGIAGISFPLQPTAAASYYAAPFTFSNPYPADNIWITVPDITLGVNITDQDGGDSLTTDFYLDDTYNGTVSSGSGEWANLSVDGLPDGNRSWYVNASDGTAFNTSMTWNFSVDTTNPGLSTFTKSPTSDVRQQVNYTVVEANFQDCTSNNPGATWTCTEQQITANTYNGSCSPQSDLSDGNYTVAVTCEDLAGNTNTSTVTVSVDTTPPTITCDDCDFPDPVKSGNTITFDPAVTDDAPPAGTPVSSVSICQDSSCTDLFCSGDPCDYTTPDNTVATRDYWIRAVDSVGNSQTTGTYNFTMLKWVGESCRVDADCLIGGCEDNVCEVSTIPAPDLLLK